MCPPKRTYVFGLNTFIYVTFMLNNTQISSVHRLFKTKRTRLYLKYTLTLAREKIKQNGPFLEKCKVFTLCELYKKCADIIQTHIHLHTVWQFTWEVMLCDVRMRTMHEWMNVWLTYEPQLAKVQDKPWHFAAAFLYCEAFHTSDEIPFGQNIIFQLYIKRPLRLSVRH